MATIILKVNLSEAATKGLQRALSPGQLPEELISLWVERHALEWAGKLKAELQDQVNDLVERYLNLEAKEAEMVKAQIDEVTKQLKK